VLDLELPALSGYEVAQRLRTDPRLATTRLIAVSGSDDRARTRAIGFEAHLVKPAEVDQLVALLQRRDRDGGL
jgi:CheY-like chemotaxis protein